MKTFGTAWFIAALAIAGPLPVLLANSQKGLFEGSELTRVDKQYAAQRATKLCQHPVEKALPTPPNNQAEVPVPVLLYHRITTADSPSREVTRPELFRAHMKWLKDEGYTTLSVKQLTNYMSGNAQIPAKPIVVTFDDGWKDNLEAVKILEEYQQKATFYIISGFFANKKYLSEEDVVKIADNANFEIGSHTHTHFIAWESKIQSLDLCTVAVEMAASKRILERLIRKPVQSIAWPYGHHSDEAVKVASQLGYTSTMMVNRDSFNRPGNSALHTRRLNIDGTCTLFEFKEMLRTGHLKECS